MSLWIGALQEAGSAALFFIGLAVVIGVLSFATEKVGRGSK